MGLNRLIAYLGLDKTGFDAGLDSAGKSASKFGSALKSQLAGAFTAVAVVSFVRSAISAAEAVGDLSERLGISVDDAQDFGLAAKMGGADIDYMAVKFEKLRAYMAAGGSLSLFDINTKDVSIAMKQLGNIIETTGFTAEQAVRFVEMFGKGSGKMINILGGMSNASAAIKFSKEDTKNAQALSDAWDSIAKSSQAFLMGAINYSPIGQLVAELGQRSEKTKTTSDLDAIIAAEKLQEEREADANGWMAIQERIVNLDLQADEINERARIAKLTNQERLLELKEEELKLQEKISLEVPVTDDGIFREEYYKMQKRLAEIGAEIGPLSKVAKTTAGVSSIASDQFQRIGAFTGSAGASAQDARAMRALTYLEQIKAALTSSGIIVKGTD
jgi:hypothetical protein